MAVLWQEGISSLEIDVILHVKSYNFLIMLQIVVPELGESVIEATLASILKKEGEFVKKDTLLFELETEKITLEIVAPCDGILGGITHNVGDVLHVGDLLTSIEEKELNASIQVSSVHHIPAIDEVKVVLENTSSVSDAVVPVSFENNSVMNETSSRLEKRTPLSSIRKTIARRLKEAQNTAAILTTFNEVDMSAVIEMRTKYKDVFEKKHGVKLGFMSFFVKSSLEALKQIPVLNAFLDKDEIVSRNYYDIGVAISAPTGLLVPILRNVDELSLAGIEKSILTYSQKAKEGAITMDDLTGGTFSISNGGIFGSLLSTPIINPPQSSILGLHKIQERPVVVNGHIVVRPMMYVALSYDHRLIDGREAVTFLGLIKDYIESPGRFMLDL